MNTYAIISQRDGVTPLVATLESFDGEFDFERESDAVADAKLWAKQTNRKHLVIERRKFLNADYHGIGWAWPDGDYCKI